MEETSKNMQVGDTFIFVGESESETMTLEIQEKKEVQGYTVVISKG